MTGPGGSSFAVRNNPLNASDPTGNCVSDAQVVDGALVFTVMRGAECWFGDQSAAANGGPDQAQAELPGWEGPRQPLPQVHLPGVKQGFASRVEHAVWALENASGLVAAACSTAVRTGVGLVCLGYSSTAQLGLAATGTLVTCSSEADSRCAENLLYSGLAVGLYRIIAVTSAEAQAIDMVGFSQGINSGATISVFSAGQLLGGPRVPDPMYIETAWPPGPVDLGGGGSSSRW